MAVAAVPAYLLKEGPEFYLSAPPGHRFLLYFAAWGDNQETNMIDWRMKDRVPKMKRQQGQLVQQGWDDQPNDQYACTIAACKTPAFDEERPRRSQPKTDPGLKPWVPLMNGLANRQSALAESVPAGHLLRFDALATAPFTTGLGNEHPLENGFAFLNPYGLPYLPGSGVKGVLRQAARELASGDWGEKHGRSKEKAFTLQAGKERIALSTLDALFGLESSDGDTQHVRGALTFWDVIPQIKGDSLMVEIMTPHQGHYYQQKPHAGSASPHDSGSPNPISFLTVPPGSGFTFFVTCDLAHLHRLAPTLVESDPANGKPRWQALIAAAFEHAFQWLGFGAKTAVGYGAMASETMRKAREEQEQARRAAERQIDKQRKQEQALANAMTWEGARIKFDRQNKSVSVEKNGKTARALSPRGEELLTKLPAEVRKKIDTNQFVKVTASVSGSDLLDIEP
jgi:CRISPR-associated protein Cmr6